MQISTQNESNRPRACSRVSMDMLVGGNAKLFGFLLLLIGNILL